MDSITLEKLIKSHEKMIEEVRQVQKALDDCNTALNDYIKKAKDCKEEQKIKYTKYGLEREKKELLFGDRFAVEYYLLALQDMVDKNGFVSLKNIYDMADINYDNSENDYLETYGYFCLNKFHVKKIKQYPNGNYKIELPEPIKLILLNYRRSKNETLCD